MAFNRTDNSGALLHATAPAAENHIELLDMLIAIATNQSVQVVGSIGAAGGASGGGAGAYQVGDILQLNGGTHPTVMAGATATFEVLTVDGSGGVTGVRLRNAGCYATIPGGGGPYATTNLTDGTATGFTVNLTFDDNGWTVDRQTSEVASAAVSAGGINYVNSETVTLTDFGSEVVAATATIAVTAGAITGFTITDGGVYHKLPATLVVTGGSGSGGVATPTYDTITDITVDRELIMTSTGGATIGIRTFDVAGAVSGTAYNWEIAGIPSYNAANDFAAQTNISPGRWDAAETGHYVVLRELTNPNTFDWFFEVNDRNIVGFFEVDTAMYSNMFLGFGDPFATTAEYPYPLLILGCSSRRDHTITSNAASVLGMNCPVAEASGDTYGPGTVYSPGGSWRRIRNGVRSGNDVNGVTGNVVVTPGGWFNPQNTAIPLEDRIVADPDTVSIPQEDWEAFAGIATGTGGDPDPPSDFFYPSPGTAQRPILRECNVIGIAFEIQDYCEIPGVRHVERTLITGQLNAQDELSSDGSDLWIVFHAGRSTNRQHWHALRASV